MPVVQYPHEAVVKNCEKERVDIQAILDELNWEDILQAEDADYQLRFLDASYEPWLHRLEAICLDEDQDFDKRRWCYEAILEISPDSAEAVSAEAILRSSKNWNLRWIAALRARIVNRGSPVKGGLLIVVAFALVLVVCSIWQSS